MRAVAREGLIVGTNVQEFFQGLVNQAVANQQVKTSEETVHYVVNLLTTFTHSETLFERTPDGVMLRPLALLYAEAVEANSIEARNQALKRLGDVALFISGVFPHSLNRKLVDVDYYISMGGNAYGFLSDRAAETLRWRNFQSIFDELSAQFATFVDVLGEVSDQAHFNGDTDLLRFYEVWMRTGSRRMAAKLRRLGIEPAAGSVSRTRH